MNQPTPTPSQNTDLVSLKAALKRAETELHDEYRDHPDYDEYVADLKRIGRQMRYFAQQPGSENESETRDGRLREKVQALIAFANLPKPLTMLVSDVHSKSRQEGKQLEIADILRANLEQWDEWIVKNVKPESRELAHKAVRALIKDVRWMVINTMDRVKGNRTRELMLDLKAMVTKAKLPSNVRVDLKMDLVRYYAPETARRIGLLLPKETAGSGEPIISRNDNQLDLFISPKPDKATESAGGAESSEQEAVISANGHPNPQNVTLPAGMVRSDGPVGTTADEAALMPPADPDAEEKVNISKYGIRAGIGRSFRKWRGKLTDDDLDLIGHIPDDDDKTLFEEPDSMAVLNHPDDPLDFFGEGDSTPYLEHVSSAASPEDNFFSGATDGGYNDFSGVEDDEEDQEDDPARDQAEADEQKENAADDTIDENQPPKAEAKEGQQTLKASRNAQLGDQADESTADDLPDATADADLLTDVKEQSSNEPSKADTMPAPCEDPKGARVQSSDTMSEAFAQIQGDLAVVESSPAEPRAEPTVAELKLQVQSAVDEGRLSEAVELLKKTWQLEPENPELYYAAGKIRYTQQFYPRAMTYMVTAIEKSAKSPMPQPEIETALAIWLLSAKKSGELGDIEMASKLLNLIDDAGLTAEQIQSPELKRMIPQPKPHTKTLRLNSFDIKRVTAQKIIDASDRMWTKKEVDAIVEVIQLKLSPDHAADFKEPSFLAIANGLYRQLFVYKNEAIRLPMVEYCYRMQGGATGASFEVFLGLVRVNIAMGKYKHAKALAEQACQLGVPKAFAAEFQSHQTTIATMLNPQSANQGADLPEADQAEIVDLDRVQELIRFAARNVWDRGEYAGIKQAFKEGEFKADSDKEDPMSIRALVIALRSQRYDLANANVVEWEFLNEAHVKDTHGNKFDAESFYLMGKSLYDNENYEAAKKYLNFVKVNFEAWPEFKAVRERAIKILEIINKQSN